MQAIVTNCGTYEKGNFVDNPIPMDIAEIRRLNLKLLIDKTNGGRQEVAERSDTQYNYFSQILMENPSKNLGTKVARRIEESFDLPKGWFDEKREREFMLLEGRENLKELESLVGDRQPILDDMHVPQFSISASMGPGNNFTEEDIVDRWPLNESVLLRMGITPSQAAITSVEGNSMLDTLHNGDLVLVDRTPVSRLTGKVYILWSERMGLQAKRVRMSTDGEQVEVISDNPDKDSYPTRSYEPESFENTFKVRGTVIKVFMGAVKDL